MPVISEVTVVVPCYNCEDTIERAFKSILQQTHLPNEIILVNDCSIDNTSLILNDLRAPEEIELIILNLETNKGPARARNIGIERSSNDLIAFLDADDTWHPKKLEIQLRVMTENPQCAISGHIVEYKNESRVSSLKEVYAFREVKFRQLIFKNYFNTPSVIIRRGGLRFPDNFRFAEDYYFWLAIANEGGQLLFIDSVLGFVHKPFYGHSGLSSSLSLMHNYEIIALSCFRKNKHVHPSYVAAAIFFARLKYVVRIFRAMFI